MPDIRKFNGLSTNPRGQKTRLLANRTQDARRAESEDPLTSFSQEIVVECRKRLLMMKDEILNRVRSSQFELAASDRMSGDEADQSVALLAENHLLAHQERLRNRLLEIEYALGRIENGQYGICEETQEPIETDRLLALPYTRLSIEGAELREAMTRKFAR